MGCSHASQSRLRPVRGLKSVDPARHLFVALDAMQLIERGFIPRRLGLLHAGGRSSVRAFTSQASSTGSVNAFRNGTKTSRDASGFYRSDRPHANLGEPAEQRRLEASA
jgi:hypothetical protein